MNQKYAYLVVEMKHLATKDSGKQICNIKQQFHSNTLNQYKKHIESS